MIRSKFSRSSKALWLALAAWASLFGVLEAQAQELGNGVQAHGFISQSLVYTSDNNVGGNSDDSLATGMRELGANLSWRPSPDWLVSGQALARWAGETDRGELRLDYGFVDRKLSTQGEDQIGLRVGKIKNPYGFFNTTRDVAHTRPGVIMPQSIYLDRIRNFFLSAPGVEVYGNHVGQEVDVSWSLGAMKFDGDDADLEHLFLIGDRPGMLQGDASWLGQVLAEFDGGRWRAGLTLGEVRMHFEPSAEMASQPGYLQLERGRNRLLPIVLSLEHNAEKYSFTGEYSQVEHISRDYGSSPLAVGLQSPNTIEAWYLQATYRASPDWRVYLRRDEIYLDMNNKTNPLTFAQDWVVGTRYDLDAWTFSAELHKVQGTLWLSPLDTPTINQKENWDMILLQAAWRF